MWDKYWFRSVDVFLGCKLYCIFYRDNHLVNIFIDDSPQVQQFFSMVSTFMSFEMISKIME